MADTGGVSLFSTSAKRSKGVKRPRHDTPAAAKEHATSDEEEAAAVPDTFKDMGLHGWLERSLASMGITQPTPVQQHCIPAALGGRHVIACAPTGSGKTAAFALPIIHTLAEDPFGIYALVLTPARELAFQVSEQFAAFGAPMGLRVTCVTGGMDIIDQSKELEARPHIVVATPGRLAHLILSSPTPPALAAVRFLVLDEADRMLDPTLAADLAVILNALPDGKARQTLAFSATMTSALSTAQGLAFTNPFLFDATPEPGTVASLRQFYCFMPASVKDGWLAALLERHGPRPVGDPSDSEEEEDGGRGGARATARAGAAAAALAAAASSSAGAASEGASDIPRAGSAIVFVRTCKGAQAVAEMLTELGLPVAALHSVMKQRRRMASLGKFKAGVASVLVATDVASRGLDIPSVGLVVNYDMPRSAEDYIHRVGRTARAGRGGTAVSLVTQFDISLLQHVEGRIGRKLGELPTLAEDKHVLPLLNKVGTARKLGEMRLEERGFGEQLELAAKRKKRSRKVSALFTAGSGGK